jgi:hypothetical protein
VWQRRLSARQYEASRDFGGNRCVALLLCKRRHAISHHALHAGGASGAVLSFLWSLFAKVTSIHSRVLPKKTSSPPPRPPPSDHRTTPSLAAMRTQPLRAQCLRWLVQLESLRATDSQTTRALLHRCTKLFKYIALLWTAPESLTTSERCNAALSQRCNLEELWLKQHSRDTPCELQRQRRVAPQHAHGGA